MNLYSTTDKGSKRDHGKRYCNRDNIIGTKEPPYNELETNVKLIERPKTLDRFKIDIKKNCNLDSEAQSILQTKHYQAR